jgi:hypothetical protein
MGAREPHGQPGRHDLPTPIRRRRIEFNSFFSPAKNAKTPKGEDSPSLSTTDFARWSGNELTESAVTGRSTGGRKGCEERPPDAGATDKPASAQSLEPCSLPYDLKAMVCLGLPF